MAERVPFEPARILGALTHHEVRFVVVGAIAAIAHGSPLPTEDVDVTPAADAENLERLARALDALDARPRVTGGDPVPFPHDPEMLAQAEVWTLTTRHGDLDLVLRPAGTRGYEDLRRDARELDLGEGVRVLVASLRDVIRSKEAANRPKDRAQLPALRQTLEVIRERERQS
jgi:hypothetical protein